MQKLVIDTNVIVSALITKTVPYQILHELVFFKHVHLCLSESVFQEYVSVLNRDKFSKITNFHYQAEIVLNMMEGIGIYFTPTQQIALLSDLSDNKFLELALEAKADFLITGNTNDFTIPEIGVTKIVTPRTYWDIFKPII